MLTRIVTLTIWKAPAEEDDPDLTFKPRVNQRSLQINAEKLARGAYNAGGHAALAADCRLVFQNCMAYTPDPASVYYQAAASLLALFEKDYAALLAAAGPKNYDVGDRNGIASAAAAVAARRWWCMVVHDGAHCCTLLHNAAMQCWWWWWCCWCC